MSKKRIEVKKKDAVVVIDKQKRTEQNDRFGGKQDWKEQTDDEHDDRVIYKRRRTEPEPTDRMKGIYLNVYYFKNKNKNIIYLLLIVFYCYKDTNSEKILQQNVEILSKLDILISKVSKLEKNNDNGSVDVDFIKVRLKFDIKLYVGSCRFIKLLIILYTYL